MDRKQAFLFGAVIAFAFTTLYFAYPPFGVAVVSGVTWFVDAAVAFSVTNWLGMIAGGAIVGFITLGAKRVFNYVGTHWFKSKTIAYEPQTQPQYQRIIDKTQQKTQSDTAKAADALTEAAKELEKKEITP